MFRVGPCETGGADEIGTVRPNFLETVFLVALGLELFRLSVH
jgi:hypothetical protein